MRIGTSGWHYDHWRGPFYPQDLSQEDFLPYYAEHFQTVEINNTFYKLPDEQTLVTWRDSVPQGFTFSVKASRYITHMKKLKDPEQSLTNFFERIDVLRDKLGPILFQLPPRWHANLQRLEAFLKALPAQHRCTFEFRDPSWFQPGVYELLREFGVAFCIYDFDRRLSPKEITADFIYVRLHGPNGAYQGEYQTEQLAGWAGAFSTWARQGKEVYCYFDNDQRGYAPHNASQLQSMLSS